MQWGLDIVGELPKAPPNFRYLLVATDYFSKWVEAEAYQSINGEQVVKFIWKHIVFRFGVPHTIISDNGVQFDCRAMQNFTAKYNMNHRFSTPYYP